MKINGVDIKLKTALLVTLEAMFTIAGLTFLAVAWQGTALPGETVVESLVSFLLSWLPTGMPPL